MVRYVYFRRNCNVEITKVAKMGVLVHFIEKIFGVY